MARKERNAQAGVPQHVIQRGNNRQNCFLDEHDFINYLKWLKAYSREFRVLIHAWVLMNNHIHLLCTPLSNNALSLMMQALGRKYVRHFNDKHRRCGTLWEGRFKSVPVQEECYLLVLYRYIELNPVAAGMVDCPSEYRWSSYQVNALGKGSSICIPHPIYKNISPRRKQRLDEYRKFVLEHMHCIRS